MSNQLDSRHIDRYKKNSVSKSIVHATRVDTGCFCYRYTDFGQSNLGVSEFNFK